MTNDTGSTGLRKKLPGVFSGPPSNTPKHFVELNSEAISEILRYGPKFVEAGAGNGYNAATLEENGADVLCYDAEPPNEGKNEYFCKTEQLHHSVLKNDPHNHSYVNQEGRTLLLIWPPLKETMAEEALGAYKGKWFVYIGDERNGAAADTNFFDLLELEYIKVDTVPTKTTRGQEINTCIFRRKKPQEKSERRAEETSASVSRAVHTEAEEYGLKAAEEFASKISVAAIIAATKHAGADPRKTMENICRNAHKGALENII